MWACLYLVIQVCLTQHPFRRTFPSKHLSVYACCAKSLPPYITQVMSLPGSLDFLHALLKNWVEPGYVAKSPQECDYMVSCKFTSAFTCTRLRSMPTSGVTVVTTTHKLSCCGSYLYLPTGSDMCGHQVRSTFQPQLNAFTTHSVN